MCQNACQLRMYEWEFVEGGENIKEKRRKKERERKERKKGKEKKRERGREKKGIEKVGEKKTDVFFLSSSAVRRSELVKPRSKVGIFDKDYDLRGKDSSYFGLFPP